MPETNHSLTIEQRIRALEILRASAWDDFSARRTFEWKAALSLWTAEAAFIAVVLTGRIGVPSTGIVPVASVAAVILVGLHIIFVRGIARGNKINRGKQFFYEQELMKLLQLMHTQEVVEAERAAQKSLGKLWNWTHGVQVAVTALFALAAVLAVYAVNG